MSKDAKKIIIIILLLFLLLILLLILLLLFLFYYFIISIIIIIIIIIIITKPVGLKISYNVVCRLKWSVLLRCSNEGHTPILARRITNRHYVEILGP